MKLEERCSENQYSRYTTTSQAPSYRSTNPRTLPQEGISQPIRRKHIAESVSCVQFGNGSEADHEYNEFTMPFRQRTNPTTSVETTRIRPSTTAKLGNDTHVVTTLKSASRNSSTRPASSSINQSSRQRPSFQSTQSQTTLSLSLNTASAKRPRKNKIKRGGSGPVPKPLPTIFNGGQSSLLSELVTLPSSAILTTTTTRSAFSLDDISFWDMDTLPSIPSPPDSPTPKNNTATTASPNSSLSYSTSSDSPFSTPYDDDALLENEIPFPLNKHSNVIIENMGIKKAKNLNKGRESLLNRHITTVRPDPQPRSGPTTPLPLRSLCQNQAPLNPAAGIPFPDTSLTSTTPDIPAGPSSSRKDAWGCIHLGAADYELSIAFPLTSHYEVWDMDDEAFFACPVFLCLMAKDPRIWTGTPMSPPDVSLIDIKCDDLPVPSSMSVYDPSIEYRIRCTVPQKNVWDRASFSSSRMPKTIPFVIDPKEITIDGKWERTCTQPKMAGGRGQTTRILRIGDATARRNSNQSGSGDNADETTAGQGWYLKFWIPIPARLFVKRETRVFEIKASVWMMSAEERVLSAMDLEVEEDDFPLVAEAKMTVSHLRREREMMMMMAMV